MITLPFYIPEHTWIDALESFLIRHSVLGQFILLGIEEIGVPLPISGEAIIAYTGYAVLQGKIHFVTALIAYTATMVIGSAILYWISSQWGQYIILKFGKFLHINQQTILKLEEKFNKYGIWSIIVGRYIPGLRVATTIIAGTSKVSFSTFILAILLSSLAWVSFFLYLGMILGNQVRTLLRTSTHSIFLNGFLILALAILIFLLIRIQRQKKR